jgi:hypothetical protein
VKSFTLVPATEQEQRCHAFFSSTVEINTFINQLANLFNFRIWIGAQFQQL